MECHGDTLVGMVHKPQQAVSTGIVCVIAGGPQYRAGVARNMVSMARALCAEGVAVMRFDHRGLGDSSGNFAGFEHTREDIQVAVDTLRAEVPEVTAVVLWGGCDAASGCMIHGCDIDGVSSMVLGNPWITTDATQAAVQKKHYLKRLGEWSFWRKLLRFEYNLLDYARALLARFTSKPGAKASDDAASSAAEQRSKPVAGGNWIERMLDGLRRFDGPVLFIMSGQSMISQEFDQLVRTDKAWAAAYGKSDHQRIDLPEADQTFSSVDARERVNRALLDWVRSR
ncbi:MAG: hydrolase 1, exosortase A system-associated [Halioglobus sp.]